jgi:hypothetical protein
MIYMQLGMDFSINYLLFVFVADPNNATTNTNTNNTEEVGSSDTNTSTTAMATDAPN